MSYALLMLDLLLASLVCVLGVLSVCVGNLRQAILLFMALGLMLSLVWLRLAAPDLALAEAALGAGILGGLLILSLGNRTEADSQAQYTGNSLAKNLLVTGVSVALAVVMGYVSLSLLANPPQQLAERLTFHHLPESGVTNPVTAVLLNYRAYDTLLELAVVLAATISVFIAGPQLQLRRLREPLSQRLLAYLLPVIAVSACYLLWVGAKAPGGAFQAGSLLAGGIVLFMLIGLKYPLSITALRCCLGAGVVAFLLVGLVPMLAGEAFFTLAPAWAGGLILAVESAATVSIAAALAGVFLGGHPQAWVSRPVSDKR